MSIDILGNEWLITCLRWFLLTRPTPYEVNILHYFEYTLELYILGAMSQAHSPQRTLSPEASLAGNGDGEASACDAAAGDAATDAGKKKHRALRRDKNNSDGNTKVIVAIGDSANVRQKKTKNSSGKTRRGTKNFSKIYAGLPEWARKVAEEANRSPFDSQKKMLQDSQKLTKVLQALIKLKSKAMSEPQAKAESCSSSSNSSDSSSSRIH